MQGENYDITEDSESFWLKEHAIMFPSLKWVRLLGVETEIYAFYLPNFVIYKMPNLYLLFCKNGKIASNKLWEWKKG